MWNQVYAFLDSLESGDVIKWWKFDMDFVFPLVRLTIWHSRGGYHEEYTMGLY